MEGKPEKGSHDMITRTVSVYKATAYRVDFDMETMSGSAVELGSVEFKGMSAPKATIRRAFEESGTPVPKGTKFKVEVVGEERWGMDLDTFMANAHRIDE